MKLREEERNMSNNRSELDVERIIEQLLSVRETPGKQVSVSTPYKSDCVFAFSLNEFMCSKKCQFCSCIISCYMCDLGKQCLVRGYPTCDPCSSAKAHSDIMEKSGTLRTKTVSCPFCLKMETT